VNSILLNTNIWIDHLPVILTVTLRSENLTSFFYNMGPHNIRRSWEIDIVAPDRECCGSNSRFERTHMKKGGRLIVDIGKFQAIVYDSE